MKWIGIQTHGYKTQSRRCWHFWFAWYPVIVKTYPDGAVKRVWFERVLRRGEYIQTAWMDCDWMYEYKEITDGMSA